LRFTPKALIVDGRADDGQIRLRHATWTSVAQIGEKHSATKPLKGFGSAAVLEVIEDYQADTYRAVYTVRLKRAVYVLHCFKKKSTKGTQTPRPDLDLMRLRLKAAQETDEER